MSNAYSAVENFNAALQVVVAGGDQAPAIVVDFSSGEVLPQGNFHRTLRRQSANPYVYVEIPGLLVCWKGGNTFQMLEHGKISKHNINRINKRFYS